jgi:hypothetical protein
MPNAAPSPAAEPVPEATAPALEPPPGGWYPASAGYPGAPQDYRPAAGAFATPGRPGGIGGIGGGPPRRGRVGLSPPFTKRGPWVNVLVFGLAPVLVAGLVVGAFVLVAPGKPAASSHSSGFRAGPGISAQQAADATSPTTAATPSASRTQADPRGSTRAGKRASMPSGIASSARASAGAAAGTKGTKSTKKKKQAKPATVTPHNLGAPNFAGYCQHIGQGTAVVRANNAYGWACTANVALVVSVQDACAWTYHLDAAQVINVSTDYDSADSWQCWRINRDLGQLNVASYCSAAGLGTATLKASNADGWYCGGEPVDFQAGCQLIYHSSDAIARFAVFADPYSWQCWD